MIVGLWKVWTAVFPAYSNASNRMWTTCERLSTKGVIKTMYEVSYANPPRAINDLFRRLSTNSPSFPHNIASYPQAGQNNRGRFNRPLLNTI